MKVYINHHDYNPAKHKTRYVGISKFLDKNKINDLIDRNLNQIKIKSGDTSLGYNLDKYTKDKYTSGVRLANFYDPSTIKGDDLEKIKDPVGGYSTRIRKDDKGYFLELRDKYDFENSSSNFSKIGQKLGTMTGGKPFDIYDRLYFDVDKKSGKPVYKQFTKAYGGDIAESYSMGNFMNNTNPSNLPVYDRLTEFKNGGSHEESKFGGIPVGSNALTEEGEFQYTTKSGEKYIFTDRF